MQRQHTTHGRGGQEKKLTATFAAIGLCAMLLFGGACVRSEKSAYLLHLNGAIDPSRDIPEEVIVAFELDRKRVPAGAVAARSGREPAN